MSNLQQIWKDIPGYEANYQASNLGNIRSLTRSMQHRYGMQTKAGQILKPHPDKKGYLRVKLQVNGSINTAKVHRLVAQTFIPNQNNLPQINHKDGDKTNNTVENLEWCTNQENIIHRDTVLVTDETRRRKKERCNTVEFKNKISAASAGAKNARAKKVIDTATGEVFGCISDAAKKFGYTYNQVKQWVNGKRKNKSTLQFL